MAPAWSSARSSDPMIFIVLAGLVMVLFVGVAIASFFVRRHAETDAPRAGWSRTDEVFRDPSSRRLMRVWLDASGARHYVAESNLPPEP